MIQVQQLKLHVSHTEDDLRKKLLKTLRISENELVSYKIKKQSIDARDKNELFYVYNIFCEIKNENTYLKRNKDKKITPAKEKCYDIQVTGAEKLKHRPVVIGSGPAGLFCAYWLAKLGYRPIVIERGKKVDDRYSDITEYWSTGKLNTSSNIQFGEGGAGTFSDGKLNTMVKDSSGRNAEVLKIFVEHGAPEDISYLAKPHIGSDKLRVTIPAIRNHIIEMGGEFMFESTVTDFVINNGSISKLVINNTDEIDTDIVVLAIGHSARDTFEVLKNKNFEMQQKAFAVGFRVEHPQSMINENQYGMKYAEQMKAASYKLTYQSSNGRGVYSFCMCPGGYVVNASSEDNMIAVNGMSDYKRDSGIANSAIIITVNPCDFPSDDVLAGVEFQRNLESKAYKLGNGKVPQQLYGDFKEGKISASYGEFSSNLKGLSEFAPLHKLFDDEFNKAFIEGMQDFGTKILDYDRNDAILTGIESRTSSPVRIIRDENLISNIKGIYPCGEGAGYAGGIMSAAMDGLKVAEAIAKKYSNKSVQD